MDMAVCMVERSVKLDTVDTTSMDHARGADLDAIDVERILERACYGGRRRLPLYQAPEYTKRLKTLENASAGEKVLFECHWSAFPRPSITWYHDDEEIPHNDVRFEMESLGGGILKLTLKSATTDDEGSYKCKAENQEGVASTTGYLSVTGNARKSRSRSNRRKHHRTVSLPPHMRTITEQHSLEEREEVDCSRQAPSPIQDFIDNIRKDRTWPLLLRRRGAEDRKSSAEKWEDHATNGNGTVVDNGAVGGKPPNERVADIDCDNPFAKRPLLPSDDRVASESDVTPNGRGVSPAARPTSLNIGIAETGKSASDACGRRPGRVGIQATKKCKAVLEVEPTTGRNSDAGEDVTLPSKLVASLPAPSVPVARKTSPQHSSPPVSARVAEGEQRRVDDVTVEMKRQVSPESAMDATGVRERGRASATKDKVCARVSDIMFDNTTDSSYMSKPIAGLVDAVDDRERRGRISPTPQQVAWSDSPVCPAAAHIDTVCPVFAPVPTLIRYEDDVDYSSSSSRTCPALAMSTAPEKDEHSHHHHQLRWLFYLLFAACCAFAGCALPVYPLKFILAVALLSMISFRLVLHCTDLPFTKVKSASVEYLD